jgi:hypothetical protein
MVTSRTRSITGFLSLFVINKDRLWEIFISLSVLLQHCSQHLVKLIEKSACSTLDGSLQIIVDLFSEGNYLQIKGTILVGYF